MGLDNTTNRLPMPTNLERQAQVDTARTKTIETQDSAHALASALQASSLDANEDVEPSATSLNKTVADQDAFLHTVQPPSSPAPIVTYADLEHYVLEAERLVLRNISQRRTLFRRVPNVAPPTLRSDCENRILVFPGSFNPPHLGHLALLWHAFLCTDDKTIAAMFLPMGEESLAEKSNVEDRGRSFKLSLHQRTQLLQDEVFGRFTWVFPTAPYDTWEFMYKVQELAAADGFKVSFPSLHGGDHFDNYWGTLGWGTGSIVASNITRPLKFIDSSDRPMEDFPKCGAWRKMHPANDLKCVYESAPPPCWPCWPCKKLRGVCPEYFTKESKDGKCTFPY